MKKRFLLRTGVTVQQKMAGRGGIEPVIGRIGTYSGMGLLFVPINIGLVVYFLTLISRAVNALEKIAKAVDRKNEPLQNKT